MALVTNELFASNTRGPVPRVAAASIQPKTFASGSGTLEKLTPVAFDEANKLWVLWVPPVTEVSKITANATPATDGTFTLTVDGETTAAIDHDAAAATIKTALEALSNVNVGDVAVTAFGGGLGASSGGVDIAWGGALKGRELTVSANFAGLTGNTHVLAEVTAGVNGDGKDKMSGFVWPDAVTLSGSGEVIGNVLMAGTIHRDDVPVVSPATQADVDAALATDVRGKGFSVQGLADFH